MRDPGATGVCEREDIGVRDRARLDDELSGAEVPPEIRVGDLARCHHEQREKENRGEQAAGGEEHRQIACGGSRMAHSRLLYAICHQPFATFSARTG